MATSLSILETRYIQSCTIQGIQPNKEVISAIDMAKLKKAQHMGCNLVVLLENLKNADFLPVLDLFTGVDTSEIDAVDIINRSPCPLDGEYVLSLLRAIDRKLRIVDLHDVSLGKNYLLDLSRGGLGCQVLNLKSSHFRKLNMTGSFELMHTLNLDFSTSLSGFRENCFLSMPKLKFLSLCETRIMNLWTTTAALIKLPSLVELRFQYCLNWDGKGLCYTAGNFLCCDEEVGYSAFPEPGNERQVISSLDLHHPSGIAQPEVSVLYGEENSFQGLIMEEGYAVENPDSQTTIEDLSDSEVDFSPHRQVINSAPIIPNPPLGFANFTNMQNEIFDSVEQNEVEFSQGVPVLRHPSNIASRKPVSYHSSPICYEKYYRDFILASLPTLKILDNLPVSKSDRDRANDIVADHFECLPYRRKFKDNVLTVLRDREIKESRSFKLSRRENFPCLSGRSQYLYSRSLSAAKVGSCAFPSVKSLSIPCSKLFDDSKRFQPRQFEYHPSEPSVMVFGTLDGEVVVLNHESGKIISYIPSLGAMHSVLGLCWLKKHPSKFIAGSDNGCLRLYDILQTSKTTVSLPGSGYVTFNDFEQLTSVHVNSTDELFIASGYSRDVVVYDINSGRRLQVFSDMHREHINVVKFSNHSPSMFATSSFDQDVKMWDLRQKPHQPCYTASSSRGNVMVCFSPDDNYLLVSAVDNEVKQLLAADGRLHLDFAIASIGSSQNYTRSYYMNGKDYVISGSCDENVVRICCAQTGRRLKDVSLEGKGSGATMFVQSLRGDPFNDFNMGILAAYMDPCSNTEIVKVNLMASQDDAKELSYSRQEQSLFGMGG